jgi:hypothetical protein
MFLFHGEARVLGESSFTARTITVLKINKNYETLGLI